MPNTDLVTVTVARGRTIETEVRAYGPGETVQVPAEEVDHLRQRGFLAEPDAPALLAPAALGPSVTQDGRPLSQGPDFSRRA